jgi:hypothetical protein
VTGEESGSYIRQWREESWSYIRQWRGRIRIIYKTWRGRIRIIYKTVMGKNSPSLSYIWSWLFPSLSYIWSWFFPVTVLYMILILPRHCLIYDPLPLGIPATGISRPTLTWVFVFTDFNIYSLILNLTKTNTSDFRVRRNKPYAKIIILLKHHINLYYMKLTKTYSFHF